MSFEYETAQKEIMNRLRANKNSLELKHAKNTLFWLLVLRPDADEVVRLAALAHDIERSVGERTKQDDYATYDSYKVAHASRSGSIAAQILKSAGYNEKDYQRTADIIRSAEFSSADLDIQLVCDADSISFFDTNIETYLRKKGTKATQSKAKFMYSRASTPAQKHIAELLVAKQLPVELLGS